MANSLSRSAQFLSGLCLVHCLATPFLVLALPSLSRFLTHDIELMLTLVVVPVAAGGFIPTWLKHRNGFIAAKFATGISLFVLGSTVFHADHSVVPAAGVLEASLFSGFGEPGVWMTMAGALLLAYTMYRNNRHVHSCHNPSHQH